MQITMDFVGLDKLIKQLEDLASTTEIDAMKKRIFGKCADETEPKMKSKMPKSQDNHKSGKKGYRPPGHAKDNIPVKVSKKEATVGWELKGDAENWFYMKFVEWGTTKQPPQDFIYSVRDEMDDRYSEIAEQEFQSVLNQKLGG